MQLDGFDDVVHIETHAFGLHNQLFHFLHQKPLSVGRRGGRWYGHRGSDSGTRFQPTFLDQVLNDAVGCIRMNPELRRKTSNGRKGLAGRKFAANESLFRGIHDLIEYRLAGTN